MVTSSEDGVHVPFDIVHLKIFIPFASAVAVDEGFEGLVIVPEPLIKVHVPVPVPEEAVSPESITLVPQTVWSDPALAVVGKLSEVTVISSIVGVHVPFEMVHLNVFVPLLKPVIEVVGLTEFVNIPLPLIRDQAPVPADGKFAAIVAIVSQIV